MLTRNKHLNIFNYYSEQAVDGKRTRPIENNLSRGLAIIMEDNALFLNLLIDFLNSSTEKSKIKKPILKEKIKIFIQGNVRKLAQDIVENELPVNNIFATTLTANITEQIGKHLTDEDKAIPDICLHLTDERGDGMILLIEVKPGNEDSVKSQVENQMSGLMNLINEKRDSDIMGLEANDLHYIPGFTWEDIVNLLQSTLSLGGRNRIIHDYIEHLERSYPEWFPTEKFSKQLLEKKNNEKLAKRIRKLCLFLNKDEQDEQRKQQDKSIYLPEEFQNIVQWVTPQLGNDGENIIIDFMIADSKGKGDKYFTKSRTFNWLRESSIEVDGIPIYYDVNPYLKFARGSGQGAGTIFFKQESFNQIDNWATLFDQIKGRKNQRTNEIGDWDETRKIYKDNLSEYIPEQDFNEYLDKLSFLEPDNEPKDMDGLKKLKEKRIIGNQCTLSIGFIAKLKFPIEVLTSYDKESKLNEKLINDNYDNTALFIKKVSDKMLKKALD